MSVTRPLDGYPDSWGAQRASVFPVTGPASYAGFTAPSTGGQVVQVSGPSGVKTVDFAVGAVSTDGLYRAEVVEILGSTLNGVPVARSAIRLKWYVLSTGAEAGALDLSGVTVYILVIGPK